MNFKKLSFSLLSTLIILLFVSLVNSCSDSNSTDPGNGDPNSVSFLMCHFKGGELGDKNGLVLVSSSGQVSWISDYYPYYQSTDYVDIKNGRIAFVCSNPPEDVSRIAYMDVSNLSNIKFIPIPKSEDEDYYWVVEGSRPQVMSDGRIIIKVTYNTVNPFDDAHDGMLAIYDPVADDFEFSGTLRGFVLGQPEQGSDTESGSMGGTFALSPDESFVCLDAYGFGTDAGVYHTDYKFLVKYDINAGTYSRVAAATNQVVFISADNQYVIANSEGKKKRFNAHSDNTAGFVLDDYIDYICVGQCSKSNGMFFKIWRGSGMAMFDVNSGWLYNPIMGDSLPSPYRGLGRGGQFSTDEKNIYFMASTDYNTNYKSPFAVMKTPADLGKTDSNPDTLFTMKPEYDLNMFLIINK